MIISDIVDIKAIEALIAQGTHKGKRDRTRAQIPDSMPLDQALRGVTTEYAEVPNVEMARYLYEHLVPVHGLESGLLPIMYAFNIPYQGNPELGDDYFFYTASDIVTNQSCKGHLPHEESEGRDLPRSKSPFIAFDEGKPEHEYFKNHLPVLIYYPWSQIRMPWCHETFDPSMFIDEVRQFWHDVIDDLKQQYNFQIKHDLVKEIR